MPALLESTSINGMRLENRIVRSATWEGLAEQDGSATPELIEKMRELARGRVGLIITGHAYVSPEGQAGPRQLGIDRDDRIPGFRRMVDAVHTEGGRIVLQVAHAGGRAAVQLTGRDAVGPSSTENLPCRELDPDGIRRLVQAFANAAARGAEAGFDGVQIHAAHGYLLSQFLSPYYNRRRDAWGGSLESRARLLLDVLTAVRKSVGSAYPVLVKLNSEDFLEGGLTMDEMLRVSEMLEAGGIDAVELSGGTGDSGRRVPVRPGRIDGPEREVYYRDAAMHFKDRFRIPLILVGGIRSYETAESLVAGGTADLAAFSRPLIRQPDLPSRWMSGDFVRSECRSCNLCFKPTLGGEGLYCYSRVKLGR